MTSLVVSAKSQWSILPGGEGHAATGWFPRGSKCDVAGQQVKKWGNQEEWVNLREKSKLSNGTGIISMGGISLSAIMEVEHDNFED